MCTLIRMDQKDSPSIAEEDFIIYKIGKKGSNGQFNCIYFSFLYVIGKLYKSEFTFRYKTNSDRGELSVYDGRELNYREYLEQTSIPYCVVAQGFHSLKELDRNRDVIYNGYYLAEFIIPRGALYYENKSGNIVSNQIIFKSFIDAKA